MSFPGTVARRPPSRRSARVARGPLRHANTRVVVRAVPDAFADAVVGRPLRSLTIVSPWLTDGVGGCDAFSRTVRWAVTSCASIKLLTRPPSNDAHARAIRQVLAEGGRVIVNPDLHAKVFVATLRSGARIAVVGSANFTATSDDLLETAIMVHSPAHHIGLDLIDDLMSGPVRRFMNDRHSRPLIDLEKYYRSTADRSVQNPVSGRIDKEERD